MDFKKINIPFIAAFLLFGMGLHYFYFERHLNYKWAYMLMGAVLNMYFAVKQKERRK